MNYADPNGSSMSKEGDQPIAPRSKQPCKINKHGWISINGEFYECSKHGHNDLAKKFGSSDRWLEQAGWIKISQSVDQIYVFSRIEPVSAQIAMLYDWAQDNEMNDEFEAYVRMWEAFDDHKD